MIGGARGDFDLGRRSGSTRFGCLYPSIMIIL